MTGKSKFDQVCESLAPIRTTTRMFYPRNIKLSENFLRAFREELQSQHKTFIESANNEGKAFNAHLERVLKALRFEAKAVEESIVQAQSSIAKQISGPALNREPKMSSNKQISSLNQKSPKKYKNLSLRK